MPKGGLMPSYDIAPADSKVRRQIVEIASKWYLLALFPILLQLFLSVYRLKNCWDDGAITAAFARTWAHTGRIALTPGSPVVEGFSSVLWFLILSLPSFFLHDPNAGLIWMKVIAACAALLSLRMIYLVAWRQFGNRSAAIVCTLLLACCYPTVMEVKNGMEMNLAALLLLLLFHVLTREQEKGRVAFASLIGLLLLLTRFEMPFTLVLLGCGFGYAAFRRKVGAVPAGELGRIAIALIACFIFISLWRHHEFAVWMPNTVYAKRFPPYRDWSTASKFLRTRVNAMAEPLHILGPAILIALGVWIASLRRRELSFRRFGGIHPAILTLALGCFLFGAAFGRNWGYDGRMVAAMVPFLILSVVGLCVASVPKPSLLRKVFALLLITQAFLWVRHVVRPAWAITMTTIEPVGIGADSVRVALHQDRLVVMMTDVGSSSLCCDHLVVIDSGFLADPTLSRTGWPGFAAYFRQVHPELVETHSFWAQGSGIYEHGLLDDYSIVAANGIRYFLRDDLFNKLVDAHAGPVVPVTSVPACLPPAPEDAQFSLTKRTCLVLNDPEVSRNFD
jgi:hypothetical protein